MVAIRREPPRTHFAHGVVFLSALCLLSGLMRDMWDNVGHALRENGSRKSDLVLRE